MESITLEQVSYLAEIIGVIAVVISLIYVGRQVRQNTEATQVTASQEFVQMYNTFTEDLVISTEIADIWRRGINDFNGLDQQDTVRFSALVGQLFRVYQSAYLQWKKGALDNEIWIGMDKSLDETMELDGIREWWETRKDWYGEIFQKKVSIMGKSGSKKTIYPTISK